MALDKRLTLISKYISHLLRHNPRGLPMDTEGFVPIESLLRKLNKRFREVTMDDLLEILRNSEKRRFEIKGDKIRAIYGHSIQVSIDYPEFTPKAPLYHGTTPEALPNILREGLKPMDRLMVHLSHTVEQAIIVATRLTSEPVVLEVDAVKAHEDGLTFLDAGDVVLTKEVPPNYLRVLEL